MRVTNSPTTSLPRAGQRAFKYSRSAWLEFPAAWTAPDFAAHEPGESAKLFVGSSLASAGSSPLGCTLRKMRFC